jgi:hypothetical protein
MRCSLPCATTPSTTFALAIHGTQRTRDNFVIRAPVNRALRCDAEIRRELPKSLEMQRLNPVSTSEAQPGGTVENGHAPSPLANR